MGATGWDYFVPYQADVPLALEQLRQKVFAEGEYESGSLLPPNKSDLERTLKACGTDLQKTIDQFTSFANDPRTPTQTREKIQAQIDHLRQISGTAPVPPKRKSKPRTIEELLENAAESGTHSILDMVRIAETPTFASITALAGIELDEIFGTREPTREQIESKYKEGALDELVRERWHGIYIIAYRNGSPDQISFAGCSGD